MVTNVLPPFFMVHNVVLYCDIRCSSLPLMLIRMLMSCC